MDNLVNFLFFALYIEKKIIFITAHECSSDEYVLLYLKWDVFLMNMYLGFDKSENVYNCE